MPTALIVEDTATERQILTACAQKAGMTVLTAGSVEEAIEQISNKKPDIVILDVVLPGRSGFELCREIKGDAATSHIPVVICSTKGSDMDKFWGMKQGANAYIPKPVDQEELVRTMKQLTGVF
jgi:two-component system, chemotaxis family, response regulator PixH